ncbi:MULTISPECIES: DUF1835 domain-containing protein, partial [unclassified Oceanispirochaeta]|uniref:DUF1835 domain-containing protein n=1 Tax=unclassified Oceanispirochaeta TaxID=2635722 RepID=UPI000E091E97
MNLYSIRYHIVFGDSAAGCLKYFLSNIKNVKATNVISISDDYSCGPLNNYDTKEGESNRILWMDQLLEMTHTDSESIKYYHDRISIFKDSLRNIEKTERIIIWYANNISDYIGLRYLSSILDNNDMNIYGINVSKSLNSEKTYGSYKPKSLGEISPENLELYLPSCKNIDNTLWTEFYKNWCTITDNNYTLRILDKSEVAYVDDTYYDPLIMRIPAKTDSPTGNKRTPPGTRKILKDIIVGCPFIVNQLNTFSS